MLAFRTFRAHLAWGCSCKAGLLRRCTSCTSHGASALNIGKFATWLSPGHLGQNAFTHTLMPDVVSGSGTRMISNRSTAFIDPDLRVKATQQGALTGLSFAVKDLYDVRPDCCQRCL